MNEEELDISPEIKEMLVSEIDFIRDTFKVLLVFLEGAPKSALKLIEDINNNTRPHNE